MSVQKRHLLELRKALDRSAPGVEVRFSRAIGHTNTLFVELIEVPFSQRGYGLGRRVLNLLCQTADAYGWTLRGSPTSDLGSNLDRLLGWYLSAGFEIDSEIPDVTITIWRPPRALSTSWYHQVGVAG